MMANGRAVVPAPVSMQVVQVQPMPTQQFGQVYAFEHLQEEGSGQVNLRSGQDPGLAYAMVYPQQQQDTMEQVRAG